MFIGELTDKRAGTKISYTYAVKGIDAYFPEIFTEKENKGVSAFADVNSYD